MYNYYHYYLLFRKALAPSSGQLSTSFTQRHKYNIFQFITIQILSDKLEVALSFKVVTKRLNKMRHIKHLWNFPLHDI